MTYHDCSTILRDHEDFLCRTQGQQGFVKVNSQI